MSEAGDQSSVGGLAGPSAPSSLLTKDELERLKLQMEIEEAFDRRGAHRKVAERRRRFWDGMAQRVALVGAIVTVLITLAGGFYTADEFLDQRSRRYDIELDQHMVALARQLYESPEGAQRQVAALMLSAYETAAIPLLLWNLEQAPNEAAQEAVIEALRLIEEKSRVKPDTVLTSVLTAARRVMRRELARPADQVREETIVRYIDAAAAFADADTAKALAFFEEAERMIDAKPFPVEFAFVQGVLQQVIGEARSRIGASQ